MLHMDVASKVTIKKFNITTRSKPVICGIKYCNLFNTTKSCALVRISGKQCRHIIHRRSHQSRWQPSDSNIMRLQTSGYALTQCSPTYLHLKKNRVYTLRTEKKENSREQRKENFFFEERGRRSYEKHTTTIPLNIKTSSSI